jgi:putative phage-type endonuclease
MAEAAESFTEQRRTGIGGSDAAAAIGISPWATPYDLWMEKLGEAEPLSVSEPMRWGTLLEPIVAAEYCRRTGREIEAAPAMLRAAAWPWMIGHIDARVVGESRILEVKTARLGIGWGEPGTDTIPLQYLTQVHHYLIVTGAEIADIAVLIGGSDFRVYEVERDDDIAGALIQQEHGFWQHVLDRSPPEPVNVRDALHRWGRLANRGSVIATEADIEAITKLRDIHNIKTEIDAAEEAAKLVVMKSLGEHSDTLVDLAGTPLATWKLDKGRKSYTVQAREPARRFLLKEED